MGIKGRYFEYTDLRDMDLMNVYSVQMSRCERIRLADVLYKTVNSPSIRFWVSEDRATIVISQMLKGVSISNMKPMKYEMFSEIFKRVKAIQEIHPERTLSDIVCEVVSGPAPKFYLTPQSAKIIIFRIKQKWFKERKKKLRHLFY